ncbi:MAG: hypothetical protein JKX72_05835 [Robiginitomaculum sp.]|nr:hypothetical protein [Robiginitomaculum sp.]
MLQIAIHIIIGVLIADLISGLIHWTQDHYGKASWPIIGGVIADNHRHHLHPDEFLTNSVLKRNYATFILIGLIGCVFAIFGWLNTITVTALIVGAWANEFHAFAHRYNDSRVLSGLRYFGLIQSPKHHRVHHQEDVWSHYCIITSYLNPAFRYFKVWRGLEICVEKITGVKAYRPPEK